MALFPEAGRSPNSAQPKVLLNPPGLSHPLFLHNLNPTLTMKSMSKPVVLALVLAGSLGSVLFTGGCAATSTQASTGQYIDDSSITVKVKAFGGAAPGKWGAPPDAAVATPGRPLAAPDRPRTARERLRAG